METKNKRNFPWAWVLLASGLVVLLACGVAAALGTGALFWITQRSPTTIESDSSLSSEFRSSPQEAALLPVHGLVEIQDQTGEWVAASAITPISQGQSVRTGHLSTAQLTFYDGSHVTLGASTEIFIETLNFQAQRRIVTLAQSTGVTDNSVVSKPTNQTTFQVRTPTGKAETKDSTFRVTTSPKQATSFSVEEGALAVTGQGETVTVETGEVSTIYAGDPPSEPAMRTSGEGAVSQVGDTWVIAGQSFKTDEHTLVVGYPQVGDIVHVEGRLLADNTRLADLIVLLRASPANHFTLTGDVQEIGAQTWVVAGQTIVIAETTQIDPSIQVGDTVRVDGVILESGALQANKILLFGVDAGLPFEFTGVVQTVSGESWTISGIPIAIGDDTVIDPGLVPGDLVWVTGRIQQDGTWLASRIGRDLEGDRIFEIAGHIESMDPWRVAGISFETRDWTDIEPGLEIGDLVWVKGQLMEDGTWVAFEIERIDETTNPLIVIIGTVISTDPWVVSGIPLNVTEETIIEGEISPGMLVRVEIYLLPDGTWQVFRITSLDVFIGIPGCMNLTASVVSIEGNRIQLLGWPLLELDENVKIDGNLRPNSVIIIQLCFNEDGTFAIIQIIIIFQPEIEVEPSVQGDKVTICHKPFKKKGGNTITISRSALPAHLAHGDYIGACYR